MNSKSNFFIRNSKIKKGYATYIINTLFCIYVIIATSMIAHRTVAYPQSAKEPQNDR